jgi:hypothetical protein
MRSCVCCTHGGGAAAKGQPPRYMQSLLAMAVFWALSRAVGPFSFLLGAYKATLGWLIRTLEIVFAALGVAAVLQLWNVPILPVLGGLGIFGVALAFGAQDLVKNVISGIFILVEKRFQPGDRIMVDGTVEGTVESISFRSITVRQPDKTPDENCKSAAQAFASRFGCAFHYFPIGGDCEQGDGRFHKVRTPADQPRAASRQS